MNIQLNNDQPAKVDKDEIKYPDEMNVIFSEWTYQGFKISLFSNTQAIRENSNLFIYESLINYSAFRLVQDEDLTHIIIPVDWHIKSLPDPKSVLQNKHRVNAALGTESIKFLVLSKSARISRLDLTSKNTFCLPSGCNHSNPIVPPEFRDFKLQARSFYKDRIRPLINPGLYAAMDSLAHGVLNIPRAIESKNVNRQDAYYKNWKPIHNNTFEPLISKETNSKKNILIAMHWLELGGAEKFAFELIRNIDKSLYNVYVCTDKPGQSTWRDYIEVHCTEIIYMHNFANDKNFASFILFLVKYLHIDLVHIHHSDWMYRSLPILKRTLPHIRVIDSTHILEKAAHAGYPQLSADLSGFIDRHHVISRLLQNYLHNKYLVRLEKIVVGYLIEEKQLKAIEKKSNVLRANYNIDKESYLIGFIGRFCKQKNPEIFIHCAKNVLEKNNYDPGISFIMIGNGELFQKCKKLIKKLKLQERIILTGEIKNCDVFIHEIDLLVMPSDNEGLALVTYEAMSANVDILFTDVGAQSEALEDKHLIKNTSQSQMIEDFTQKICAQLKIEKTGESKPSEKLQAMYESGNGLNCCLRAYEELLS